MVPDPTAPARYSIGNQSDQDVPDEAHLLLEETTSRVNGPLTVILERDGAFPSIEALVAELDRIRATLARGRRRRRPDTFA